MTMPLDERDVRRIARDELRRMLGRLVAEESVYSTRQGEAPPGYSRDAWRAIAHAIGAKRGRYYYVSQQQLEAYERGQREPANDPAPSTWTPADAARALGLRPAAGGR